MVDAHIIDASGVIVSVGLAHADGGGGAWGVDLPEDNPNVTNREVEAPLLSWTFFCRNTSGIVMRSEAGSRGCSFRLMTAE